jgi:N-acetylglucosamine-6-sulfatase
VAPALRLEEDAAGYAEREREEMRRLASLLMIATSAIPVLSAQPRARAAGAPNVIVIMTDDQRWDALQTMPTVRNLLQAQGVTYTNAFVPNSLCCPSRSSTLSGLNSHTTGVWGITPPNGGFASFHDGRTLATVLHDQAGYHTMLVGKYLNGYPEAHYSYVPPGWDRWFSITSGAYYDYYAADNGVRSPLYGTAPQDYSGRVLTAKALDYLAEAPTDRPFFLYYAPTAPHYATKKAYATPDPLDVDALQGNLPPYRPPSFGTTDPITDMPPYIQANHMNAGSVDTFRRRQLESLIGVDRDVGELLAAAPPNTLVIFTSDNGYQWGEHDWHVKQVPYEESIRVPLIMRWDGHLPAGATRTRIALNVDLAATIARVAGIDPTTVPLGLDRFGVPRLSEGLDLFGSKRHPRFVLEHYDNSRAVPPYCGIRTKDGWMYARYWDGRSDDVNNGFEELYHVATDPYELTNLAMDASSRAELAELRRRTRHLCAPIPPGYTWSP